ncbi:hypothetical protein BVG80_00695 [Sphingobacteriales bacterium TSM_CSM]|nr:hypothetical protein BVG80_00695 [Sphingobacteriales bacterium TSM_CSM]
MKNVISLMFVFAFMEFYPIKNISAQTFTYFNKTYKPDTINILSPACLSISDGYLFAGSYGSYNTLKHGFYIRKTDLSGETQWFQTFEYGNHTIYAIGGGILTKAHNGTYMLVGSRTYESGLNQDIVMINFLEDGTHLWTKIIENPNTIEYPYQITPTQDGGYIMCGIQRSFSSSNRFYVLKTDAWGNKEWDRVYNPLQHASAFSVFETFDGYIVSGYMYNAVTNYDMVIVQIDKLGDVIWQKFYGGNDSDSGCLLSSNADGNSYLAIGSIKSDNKKKPFIFSIDMQGNILWQKMYETEVRALQEAPIFRTENDGAICIYGFDNQFGKTDIRIFKFTSTGDTLWTRTIPGLNPNDNWYLKDIAAAPDGGYIFSGFNYSQQSSWVVKTDSLGNTCSFIGCDSTVVVEVLPGIPSNSNPEVAAMVYPVPASTHLFIRYQIPAGILPSGGAVWRLYDALGRQVAEETLQGSTGTEQVPVEHLPAGIYYYRVVLPSSGQAVASGKVVVE